jgi:hypothetical protein
VDAFNQLLSQFGVEQLIILFILTVFFVRALGDAIEWIYKKAKAGLQKDMKTERAVEQHEVTDKKIKELNNSVVELCEGVLAIQESLKDFKQHQGMIQQSLQALAEEQQDIQERFQFYIRAFIIDKYHYHCFQLHKIDDQTMDNLEHQYIQYKSHGGNSFIDGLMDRLRQLPRSSSLTEEGEQ